MLVPISIDVSDLADEFSMSKEDIVLLIDNAVKAVSLRYWEAWQSQASNNLGSTRNRYLNSLVLHISKA